MVNLGLIQVYGVVFLRSEAQWFPQSMAAADQTAAALRGSVRRPKANATGWEVSGDTTHADGDTQSRGRGWRAGGARSGWRPRGRGGHGGPGIPAAETEMRSSPLPDKRDAAGDSPLAPRCARRRARSRAVQLAPWATPAEGRDGALTPSPVSFRDHREQQTADGRGADTAGRTRGSAVAPVLGHVLPAACSLASANLGHRCFRGRSVLSNV